MKFGSGDAKRISGIKEYLVFGRSISMVTDEYLFSLSPTHSFKQAGLIQLQSSLVSVGKARILPFLESTGKGFSDSGPNVIKKLRL
jgi:hypothetical protein